MAQTTTYQLTQHLPFVRRMWRLFFDFEDPQRFIDLLHRMDGEPLFFHWESVGRGLAEGDYSDVLVLPTDGLTLSTHDLGSGLTATAITLPRHDVADYLFVALVVPPKGVKLRTLFDPASDAPRFFTLEDSRAARCFLCEWPSEKNERHVQHMNYGTVERPTLGAFLAGLRNKIVGWGTQAGTSD
jgi:hypothetical protein